MTLQRLRRPAGGPANWQREPLDKAIVSNTDRRVWRCRGEGRVGRHTFALLAVVLILNGGAGAADPVLAPTGTLRAAYIVANLAQARLDSGTGAITGVVADLTRELARRAGVPAKITPLPTAAAVLEAVRSDAAYIGFVAPNPERTGVVLYSQTYMLVQQSALVRTDSPLRSVRELDRSGHIIGINTDDSVGVWLRERLTAARLRATPDYTLREAVQWLQDGTVVAFAGGRQRLTSGTQNVPGLRLLDDNFYGVPQTIAVPLDRKDRLQLVNAALDELRANGFLADSVARSGVEGLTVAPVDTPSR
ncbi:MAG TPA: transporter substrate-binding domain-containing protein [Casimicrobiaceae bacterium]